MSRIVPYTPSGLREETKQWAIANNATLVPVDTDRGYWRLLLSEWDKPDALVVVEHDIVPSAGVVSEMEDCERTWCTSPYLIGGTLLISQGLGCAKFSHDLKTQFPMAISEAGKAKFDNEPFGAWWTLDYRLASFLMTEGIREHVHRQSTHLIKDS